MKIYITAQSMQKRDIETKLSISMTQTIEHLLKLYLMPDNPARNHWQGEVYGFIHTVEKLKRTNKYPTAQNIYNWTYEKVQDLVTDASWLQIRIEDICDQYNIDTNIPLKPTMHEFDALCVNYFQWLAEMLSKRGSVTNREVYTKLDSLV